MPCMSTCMSKQPNFANNMSNGFSTIVNAYYAIDNLFVETSQPSDGSKHTGPDGEHLNFIWCIYKLREDNVTKQRKFTNCT